MEPAKRRILMLAAAGLGLGLGFGLLAPPSWVFLQDDGGSGVAAPDGRQWACPMFCTVMDQQPPDGKCPVCGMELGEVSRSPSIDMHERTMIGLDVEKVGRHPLAREIRLVGEVDYDETRLAVISARAMGWLESVKERVTWTRVEKDDVLFEMYAPAVWEAQQELIIAREDVVAAARERLSLLGVAERDIDAVREKGKPLRAMPYRAPSAGTIVRRTSAVEGAAVRAGQEIYAIADLGRVWLQMEAFESEIEDLHVGMSARVRTEHASTDEFAGRIFFTDPVVDRKSRTARVRIEVDNPRRPDGRYTFLPGQRVEARVSVRLGEDGRPVGESAEAPQVLSVPRSSVLRTGKRTIVYVVFEGDGADIKREVDPERLPARIGYELVEVKLGPLARRADAGALEEYYPVLGVVTRPDDPSALRRLKPGHVVVTNGALLLDSQAQLAGRPSLFYPKGRVAAAADPHAGH